MKNKICVCVGNTLLDQALAEAEEAARLADVVEVRLDLLAEPVVIPFISRINRPLLFTNRAKWEGGNFQGTEEQRLAPLLQAIEQRGAYVDLELLSPISSWQQIKEKCADFPTKIVCSWHNFTSTPSSLELRQKLEDMRGSGAHIGKIVTMAADHSDVLRVLNLQEIAADMDFPLIAFCMGEPGKISRVTTCSLGGYMTYCSVDGGSETAPGQITVSNMREIHKLMGAGI